MKKRIRGVFYKHPKYKGRNYQGTYERDADGDRVLALVFQFDNEKHSVFYESHQAAAEAGWKKVGGK